MSQSEAVSEAPVRARAAEHLHELAYRSDIDGLRAVAVLSVVGFHAFPHRLAGGFIGVDIFFVISGYLISGLIYKALREKRFSYGDFYARRIRRIFPALLTVLSATLVAGALWLYPSEYAELGRQTVAGAAFVANLLFWSESGYFDAASQLKPLLHLWSLGVEEQFYIAWPLVLAVLYTRTAKLRWIVAGVALVSFVCSVLTLQSNPVAAFYSPATRFWELLLGAMLAHRTLFATPAPSSARGQLLTEVISWAGLLLVAGSLLLLDESQPFPGWLALPPTVGALCMIAGREAWLNRKVLSHRVLVFIGLISYPLYLWHWVLFTTFQRAPLLQASKAGRLPLVGLSFLLAWLTYELIEKPVRFGKRSRRSVAVSSILGVLVALAGVFVVATHGAAFRYPSQIRPFASFEYDASSDYREDICEVDPDRMQPPFKIDARCVDPPGRDARLLVLWGDSHAASLYQGLEALRQQGAPIRIAQVTAGACPPLLGVRLGKRANCLAYNEQILAQIERMQPDTVIIGGAWAAYAARAGSADEELAALQQTVRRLQAGGVKRVVVFGSLPVWKLAQPNVALAIWRDTQRVPPRTYSYFDPAASLVDGKVGAAMAQAGAVFVSPIRSLCNESGCLLSADSDRVVPVTWDTNHLTRAGSRLLVSLNEVAVLGQGSR